MANFPQFPRVNDTYVYENTLWKFNGEEWDRVRIGIQNKTQYAKTDLQVSGDVTNVDQLPGPTTPNASREGNYYFLVVDANTGDIKVLEEKFLSIPN